MHENARQSTLQPVSCGLLFLLGERNGTYHHEKYHMPARKKRYRTHTALFAMAFGIYFTLACQYQYRANRGHSRPGQAALPAAGQVSRCSRTHLLLYDIVSIRRRQQYHTVGEWAIFRLFGDAALSRDISE